VSKNKTVIMAWINLLGGHSGALLAARINRHCDPACRLR
jgi:hypothetical protein